MKIHYTFKGSLKSLLFILPGLLILGFFPAMADEINYPDHWDKNGFTLTKSNSSGVSLNFSVEKLWIEDMAIDGAMMKNIQAPGIFLFNDAGAPNLPGTGRYIAVPQGADVRFRITAYRTEVMEGIDIAPAPEIPFDNDNSPLKYRKDMDIYAENAFYPAEPVIMSKLSQIRGVDVVLLGITPFQYNPVTKELIIYRDLKIEIEFTGGTGHFGDDRLRSRWWDPIIKDAVLNPGSLPEIDHSLVPAGDSPDYEYIIISPNDPVFLAWADSIRDFRTRQGIYTGVVTTAEIGGNTTSAIETYINNAYNTWDIPPAAVLLLGDYGTSGNTVVSPIYDSYCVSDNIYADVNGDHMPDVILARMTAQNATHLETMITKFLNYERNPPTNPGFYNNPITALGWQTERWFQICSETVGGFWKNVMGKSPVRINEIYSGTPGTVWSSNTNTYMVVDYFGPAGTGYIPATPAELGGWSGGNATMINNAINNGAFMLQHRDHGAETGWGEPAYNSSNIDGLHNTDLVWVFSINCLTGKYNYSGEVFAEKFHRYQYNGQNSGALGITAASEVSYSFVNDAYVWGMMDNMWENFMPTYGTTPGSRDVLPAFGNAAGKFFLQQSGWPYNPQNKEVTYNLFHHHGDAFTTVYTQIPQTLTVIHDPVMLSGLSSFSVNANDGSLICLSANGVIIGKAQGTGSPLNITITPQMPGTEVLVTITKQDFYRYESSVMVIPPSGPYVVYDDHQIHDASGNNNGMADYGENITLHMTLQNLGSTTANNIVATVTTTDPHVNITDNTQAFGPIASGGTGTVNDAFGMTISGLCPDQHTVLFELQVTGNADDTWTSYFTFNLHSPVLVAGDLTVDDATGGNGNGRLDPGETADIRIEVINNGSSNSPSATSTLATTNANVTINTGTFNTGVIAAGSAVTSVFNVSVDPSTPIGELADFIFNLNAGPYSFDQTFYKSIGLVLEDWESGDFTNFNWGFEGNANWMIEANAPYEGVYCAKSGVITHSQSSKLTLQANVATAGNISFYTKVSSQANYDYLKFYIDGVMQGQWSGTLGWTQVSYPVTTGKHKFTWSYEKNASTTTGSDCGWIDYIIFPQFGPEIPEITVSPGNLDFGPVFIGDIYTKSVNITNNGTGVLTGTLTTPLDVFTVGCVGGDNTLPYTIMPGITQTFNVSFAPLAIENYSGNMVITHNASGPAEDVLLSGSGINGLPLPYTEDFEENGAWPYAWINPTNDDFDWTLYQGATPSSSTGPSGDHTTGSGWYIYTEASSPNYPSKTAIIEGPVFDLAGATNPAVTFWYHMFGSTMGELHLDALYQGSWIDDIMPPVSGNQGDQWIQHYVSLAGYSGTIKLRFRGITGSNYYSDMAIDDFWIGDDNGLPVISLTPSSLDFGSIWTGTTSTLTFSIGNTGSGVLTGSITTPDGYTVSDADNTITYSVPMNQSRTFNLQFTPALAQQYNGIVEITTNDPLNPVVNLMVYGTGINPPDISVSATGYYVVLPPDGSVVNTMNIQNSGDDELDYTLQTPNTNGSFKGKINQTVEPELLSAILSRPDLSNTSDELNPEPAITDGEPVFPPLMESGDGEEVFGGWTSTWSGEARDRGNVFLVTTSVVLSEHRFYLNISASTQLYFFVYEGNGITGTYTKISEVLIPASGTGEAWYSSGPVSVNLTAGKYYYIGASWNASATYGRGNQTVPFPCSFGSLVTGIASTLAGYPPAATVNKTTTSTYSPYYQTIVTGYGFTWLLPDPIQGSILPLSNSDVDLTFDATGLTAGTYTKNLVINSNDPDEPQLIIPCTLVVANEILTDLSVMLEGPYNGTQMDVSLNNFGYLPLSQPYASAPWNYNGTESVAAIPNADVVDWVLVELRQTSGGPATATGGTVIARRAAFLLKNGQITDLDGTSPVQFITSVSENLYTVIWHRNHLAVMSANPLDHSGNIFSWNFPAGDVQAFGGSLAHKDLGSGVYGMISGDADANGQVSTPDKILYWKSQAGTSGYKSADFTLDGYVNNLDKIKGWSPNAGKASQVP